MLRLAAAFSVVLSGFSLSAAAQDVRITPDITELSFAVDGKTHTIGRIQNTENRLSGEFTKTSRVCPPFCITPMEIAPGVTTVGEIEVLDFLENEVANKRGLLLDSRVPEWYAKGSIPGAINLPFTTLDANNPYRDAILKALGGVQSGTRWNFDGALSLMMFCNGPWCDQSPHAARALIAAGYPVGKLFYYRGGMQVWQQLGLTVVSP